MVDPEDDLPSATYAGDFETTMIPHYDSADSGSVRMSSSGYGLIGGGEPLGAQRYQSSGRQSVFGTDDIDEIDEIDEDDERVRAAGRRGTQSLG
ncbi:MAG: hypothetical protein ACRDU4_21495, partial [Mycobacterium sp.]